VPLKPHRQPGNLMPGSGISVEIDKGDRCQRLSLLYAGTCRSRKEEATYSEQLKNLHEGSPSV
jgi:hypothetical protein